MWLKRYIILFGILFIIHFCLVVFIFSIYDWLVLLGLTYFCLLPAFLSNACMTFAGKFPVKLYPIDGGRMWKNTNKRILGDGKTWNGIIIGIFFSFLICLITSFIYFPLADIAIYRFELSLTVLKLFSQEDILFFVEIRDKFNNFLLRILLMSIGAPVGDLIGSFIKRRVGKERGGQIFLIDQLDFIAFSVIMVYPIFPIPWYFIIFIFISTPLVAIFSNVVAYYLDLKKVPW